MHFEVDNLNFDILTFDKKAQHPAAHEVFVKMTPMPATFSSIH
jgi:hypothetical protein